MLQVFVITSDKQKMLLCFPWLSLNTDCQQPRALLIQLFKYTAIFTGLVVIISGWRQGGKVDARQSDECKEVAEGSEEGMHVWKEDILLVGALQQRETRAAKWKNNEGAGARGGFKQQARRS